MRLAAALVLCFVLTACVGLPTVQEKAKTIDKCYESLYSIGNCYKRICAQLSEMKTKGFLDAVACRKVEDLQTSFCITFKEAVELAGEYGVTYDDKDAAKVLDKMAELISRLISLSNAVLEGSEKSGC